jgi:hypothetical protein
MADYMYIPSTNKTQGLEIAARFVTGFSAAALFTLVANQIISQNIEAKNPEAGLFDGPSVHQIQKTPAQSLPDNVVTYFPMGTL